jgi:D-glycero-alpha-D-manno-heptose-7-phosphate kinase
LKHQQKALDTEKAKQRMLQRMVKLAHEMRSELQRNNAPVFGEMLHENWELKRQLAAGVTTTQIDDWYTRARKAGAIGGKLLGAGSGGFMMYYAPPERHEAIRRALKELRPVQFGFEPQGSKIIFVHD